MSIFCFCFIIIFNFPLMGEVLRCWMGHRSQSNSGLCPRFHRRNVFMLCFDLERWLSKQSLRRRAQRCNFSRWTGEFYYSFYRFASNCLVFSPHRSCAVLATLSFISVETIGLFGTKVLLSFVTFYKWLITASLFFYFSRSFFEFIFSFFFRSLIYFLLFWNFKL